MILVALWYECHIQFLRYIVLHGHIPPYVFICGGHRGKIENGKK